MEEIFDVVNDLDEVIDHRCRSEVHRLGLRHRAVHVLVFNHRGEIFLQKRSMSKDSCPGMWDSSASGHLDCGEDYDACARREVTEELGVQLDEPPQRIFKLEACPQTGEEFVWVYRGRSEGPFRLHPEEIETGKWVSPAELSDWLKTHPGEFASAVPVIWKKFLELK